MSNAELIQKLRDAKDIYDHGGDDDLIPEALQQAADALSAYEWQPIETAPKDGTKFDVWCINPDNPDKGVRFTDVQMRGDKTGFGFVVHLSDGVRWQYLDARGKDSIFPKWIPVLWMAPPKPITGDK